MRAFLLSLSLSAVCLSVPASAQNLQAYGLRGGVNTSNVGYDFFDDGDHSWLESETGFQLAAFVEVGIPVPFVSALVEAEYAQRAYRWSGIQQGGPELGSELGGSFSLPTSTLRYASVPVLAKVEPVGLGGLAPYLLAGPRLDVLVGKSAGSMTREVEGEDGPVEFRDGLPDVMDTVGLSGVVGAGLGLGTLIGPDVRIEARYGFGLTNLIDSDNADWRGRGLDFSLALAF